MSDTSSTGSFKKLEKRLAAAQWASLPTAMLDIVNNGADAKHGLEVSIYDQSGFLARLALEGDFPVGTAIKYNLSTLNKKLTRVDLMYRGQDGIGRYLHPLVSGERV